MISEGTDSEKRSLLRLPEWIYRPQPALVGVAGIVITILISSVIYRHDADVVDLKFDSQAEKVRDAVSARMDAYEQVLRGGLGLFNASDEVTSKEWKTYISELKIDELYPGIQGIGFAKSLEESEISSYEAGRRSEGLEDFSVWPAHEHPAKSAIQFLEPLEFRNRRAIGFDMLSNETRRKAIEESTLSGHAMMSGKVTLVQETETDVQAGFLTYLPYYRGGKVPDSAEKKKEQVVGWVYSPFRMNDFMEGILGESELLVDIRVFAGIRKSEEARMFGAEEPVSSAKFTRDVALPMRGQTWLLEISSLPPFEKNGDYVLAWAVLGGGMIVTILLMMMVVVHRRTEAIALSIATEMTSTLQKREREVKELNRTLEEKVEERTRELTHANEELQEFSRTVSHDLRAPLRSIRSFSQIVIADYSKRLDESGVALLERIDKAGLKLEQTIDDILSLTTISRQKPERQEINLSNLAFDICTMLQEGEPDREVKIDIRKGVIARGDKVMMERAMQNLLQNAWKFSRKNPDAKISFGEETIDGERQFFVRDNGVGFDSKFKDEIFKPFRRLHHDGDFEGTGLGMASTRKMINRHGGRIWAESKIGEGADFRFTLGRIRRASKRVSKQETDGVDIQDAG